MGFRMIKKLLIGICLILLLTAVFANGPSPFILAMVSPANPTTPCMKPVTSAACSATYTEPFTTANTDDVDGNTMFDAELDNSADVNVLDNELTLFAETYATNFYIAEQTLSDVSELTIKFTVEFSDITGVDNGTSVYTFMRLEANGSEDQVDIIFQASGGNFSTALAKFYYDGGDVSTSTIDMSGFSIDTSYDFVLYWIKDASAGGVSLKIGAGAAVTTGFNEDNSGKDGVGDIKIGGISNFWGDGTDDMTFTVDDFEIYLCDAR